MSQIRWFDTHAHLPMLTHDPVATLLSRAKDQGVDTLVTVATELSNWESSRLHSEQNENVFYTLGLHPHQAAQWNECRTQIELLFKAGVPAKCVGIGETGLDFHYNLATREDQIEALESQLAFAKKYDLPVVLHCRDAFPELFESIRRIGLSSAGGVMHCFTGSKPDAHAAIDLGLVISFSGILTFRNAEDLRSVAKGLPLTKLVLETDCPYLAPVPHRGKPNEPSYLPQTGAGLAELLGVSLEALAHQTTQNARELFQIG